MHQAMFLYSSCSFFPLCSSIGSVLLTLVVLPPSPLSLTMSMVSPCLVVSRLSPSSLSCLTSTCVSPAPKSALPLWSTLLVGWVSLTLPLSPCVLVCYPCVRRVQCLLSLLSPPLTSVSCCLSPSSLPCKCRCVSPSPSFAVCIGAHVASP